MLPSLFSPCPQLIFRKVSDVKREKELAERRKHEPLQELSQDHLVRKIFSKFRKNGGSADHHRSPASPLAALPSPDVERGGMVRPTSQAPAVHDLSIVPATKVVHISEAPPSHAPKLSRWATLRSDSTVGSDNKENQPAENVQPKQPATAVLQAKEPATAAVVPPRPSATPTTSNGAVSLRGLSKWAKSMGSKHETIEEAAEPEMASPKTEPEESQPSVARQQQQPPQRPPPLPPQDASPHGAESLLTPRGTNRDYQQLLANLMDMRVDLKMEIQRLHTKVSRIDDHLMELLKSVSSPSGSSSLALPSPRAEGPPEVVMDVPKHCKLGRDSSEKGRGHSLKRKSSHKARAPDKEQGKSDVKSPAADSVVRAMLESEIAEQESEAAAPRDSGEQDKQQ